MKRPAACVAILVLLTAALLGIANAFDGWRFHRAWNIGETLGADALRDIARAAIEAEKHGHWRPKPADIPAAFARLHPLSATFYPQSSDFSLYESGDVYVVLRIRTSPENQEILVFTNSFGRQRTETLWRSNPTRFVEMNPSGRVVTLSESTLAGTREWMVLPEEIRLFDRPHHVGGDDTLILRASISEAQRKAIEAAIADLPLSLRGGIYTSGAADGIHLRISFAPDGTEHTDDIALANTWHDAVGPLMNAISQSVPPEHTSHFREQVTEDPHYAEWRGFYTWAEWEAREPVARVPWWCVWRWWKFGQRLTSPSNLAKDSSVFWSDQRSR